ncbi:MAG: hypothetical protein AAB263_12385 [Planctomycetota bacterium]
MKHIYWWICAAAAIALLTMWFFIVPTDAARKSKSKIDEQLKSLGKLAGLANKGSPAGVFNAESSEDTKRLSESYLVTENWKNVLDPLGDAYQKQLDVVKQQLVSRSKYLRTVITADQTKIAWYKAYISESEKLIKGLRESGLIPPMDKSERFGSDGITEDVAQKTNSTRAMLSLHSDPNTTDSSKYTSLTARLRVLQLLTGRLLNQSGEIAVNPLGPTNASRPASGLSLTQLSFTDGVTGEHISRPVTSIVSSQITPMTIGVSLRLRGPVSHLYAAVNALEHNAEPDRPLVVISRVKLERRDALTPSDYLDVSVELAEMTVDCDVIEFAMPTDSQPAAGAQP